MLSDARDNGNGLVAMGLLEKSVSDRDPYSVI